MGGHEGIEIVNAESGRDEDVLGDEALAFVGDLHREFRQQRHRLLSARAERQHSLDSGEWPDFNPATRSRHGGFYTIFDEPSANPATTSPNTAPNPSSCRARQP